MSICNRMKRGPKAHPDDIDDSKRHLGIYRLIALGLGGTLGQGIYVLNGQVAHLLAGPAVTLCVFIGAVVSILGGICYADISSRLPRPGSAYVYSYAIMGEFVAFTVGWSMILEYMTSTASAAHSLSAYLDALLDQRLSRAFQSIFTMNTNYTSSYPDFLALGLILLSTFVIAFGTKKSFLLNLVFIAINLITITVVIITGTTKSIYIYIPSLRAKHSTQLTFFIRRNEKLGSQIQGCARGHRCWRLLSISHCENVEGRGDLLLWVRWIRLHHLDGRRGHQSHS